VGPHGAVAREADGGPPSVLGLLDAPQASKRPRPRDQGAQARRAPGEQAIERQQRGPVDLPREGPLGMDGLDRRLALVAAEAAQAGGGYQEALGLDDQRP
jgi:hypothetical protein